MVEFTECRRASDIGIKGNTAQDLKVCRWIFQATYNKENAIHPQEIHHWEEL